MFKAKKTVMYIDVKGVDDMTDRRDLMKEIIRKYPNIYLIGNPLPSPENRDTCTDGSHPSDLGYYFWAKNLEKKIIEILNKNKCL